MKEIHSYPKVHALGHPELDHLFADPVFVQEKLDGSQISFGIIDGDLKIRSKNKMIDLNAPDALFDEAVDYLSNVAHMLVPGWIYRAEWLKKPKHNTLEYPRRPLNGLALFDIEAAPNRFLEPHDVSSEANKLDIEHIDVTAVFDVAPTTEDLDRLLAKESMLGGPREGVVFKNYQRYGRDDKALMGKFVSEAFKETHDKDWKNRHPSSKDIVSLLAERYCTEARWEKAVQHAAEDGYLEHDPRDIGKLIGAIQGDIIEECKEEIKEQLWNYARKDIMRKATKGFPEWYKRKLAERQREAA